MIENVGIDGSGLDFDGHSVELYSADVFEMPSEGFSDGIAVHLSEEFVAAINAATGKASTAPAASSIKKGGGVYKIFANSLDLSVCFSV
ncbi:TPA: hypothetical protein ACJKDK_002081, partial [Neisseria meningitidis]